MEELKVLFILENFYGYRMGRAKLKFPVYGVGLINKKNATYSRIIPYFNDTPFRLYFGETTALIAKTKDEKFDIDLEWLKKTLECDEWFAVIACCKKAQDGLKQLKFEPFMSLPHPTSWKWRKQMMIDCIENLNKKKEEYEKS